MKIELKEEIELSEEEITCLKEVNKRDLLYYSDNDIWTRSDAMKKLRSIKLVKAWCPDNSGYSYIRDSITTKGKKVLELINL